MSGALLKLNKIVQEKFPLGVAELRSLEVAELLQILLKRAEYTGPTGARGEQGLVGEKGDKGEQGDKGDKGEQGEIPAHEWLGTKLRFQNADGTWGEWVELKGLQGDSPEFQWSQTKLRFKNPDGTWGEWVNLKGDEGKAGKIGRDGADGKAGKKGEQGPRGEKGNPGKEGPQGKVGPKGPMPKHELDGQRVRFELADGSWGPWIVLGTTAVYQTVQEIKTEDTNVIKNVPCDVSVFVGAAVIIPGGTALNGKADTYANSLIKGFCVSKISDTLCNVRVGGISETIFALLDPTRKYFLSETNAGEITTTPPTGAGHFIAPVGRPFDGERLIVEIGNRIQRAL